MEILGYFFALLIGISLGLVGAGGSILAVPVLAYCFGLDEQTTTAYSLFVVGGSALLGGVKQNNKKNVDWRIAVIFGIPAILGVWLVRHFVVPVLPEHIFALSGFIFTRRMVMFGLFAILMFLAASSMLKKQKIGVSEEIREQSFNYPLILLEGLLVGGITGFVGAGGGFLIIPALIFLTKIEIKKAIGTSLIIIAIKSLFGFFLGDALILQIDWRFLMSFTSLAFVGIFVGTHISKFVDGTKLKKAFGYFIIVMAVFIFITEFLQ
ncbi:sulfite exporter TauE/SafE family protein [Mesonia sp. K7]|uniref:sulfite exporter TauE/SafE family protein n=1 Tax=Mesonia sp. K7 TaxID=2218606 RepID=UPI000DA7CF66|nr:sulfite exporter TauE/SafE family protein [Mesonia sp. K7]PZD77450.1 sulfite exporter TauE/SafE family protein [Mesonia sp. K7]